MIWQPIETAPRDGTEVLLYGEVEGELRKHGLRMAIGRFFDHDKWYVEPTDGYAVWIERPMFWAPLVIPKGQFKHIKGDNHD